MPENLNGFEFGALIFCAVPVVSMLLVAVGAGLLGWKLVARMETQSRDLMKCLMALSSAPAGPQMAAMMESTDAQRDRLQAEASAGKPSIPMRRAQ